MKKIHACQFTVKKIHAMAWKKNSYKEFDDEKKFLRLENSPPPLPLPITFLMVRLLKYHFLCLFAGEWVLTSINICYLRVVYCFIVLLIRNRVIVEAVFKGP